MTEDNTKDLSDSEKLNLILSELAEMKTWRASIDALLQERLRETRPLLESLHSHVDRLGEDTKEIKADINEIKRVLRQLAYDVTDTKTAVADLESRVSEIERKPS